MPDETPKPAPYVPADELEAALGAIEEKRTTAALIAETAAANVEATAEFVRECRAERIDALARRVSAGVADAEEEALLERTRPTAAARVADRLRKAADRLRAAADAMSPAGD